MSKPGKWLYVVAGVVAVGGSAASVVHGCSSSTDSIHTMKRGHMPGELRVELSAGRHGVFTEHKTSIDGKTLAAPGARTIECTLTGVEAEPIELIHPNRVQTYDLGGYAGALVYEIDLLRGGPHTLSCTSDAPGPFYVAIGDGFTVGDVLMAIVGGAVSVMLGLAIFFFTFIRRRSARGQARAPDEPRPSET